MDQFLAPETDIKHQFLDPETDKKCQFLDGRPETDVMDQFLDPETDIMGEGNFIVNSKLLLSQALSTIIKKRDEDLWAHFKYGLGNKPYFACTNHAKKKYHI